MELKQLIPSRRSEIKAPKPAGPARVFGLRYIEEEAAEIHDVVGCQMGGGTCTTCDDIDRLS